jgi:hypothetical protein
MPQQPHITGKTSHLFKKGQNFSGNAFKKNQNLYKSLNFSENSFKMPRILKKKKTSYSQKKKPRGNFSIATMVSSPLRICIIRFADHKIE